MKLQSDKVEPTCLESDVYHRMLALDGKNILELGCGDAVITRNIATAGSDRTITALEVDEIAHQKNLQVTDLPNVRFERGGAEDIPLKDESVDVVFMFKSLHHVPIELMGQSMREIRRVLKPGGELYISEPVYAGEFNDILRLFHDERLVREAAFDAVKKAIDDGLFTLVEEAFFQTPMVFESFDDFENRVINVTHTSHNLDAGVYQRVKQLFETHLGDDGALFLVPIRVDLLRKPSTL